MQLISINDKKTATFLLADGRKIKSYQSGYVRIEDPRLDRLYQINKTIRGRDGRWYTYKRILIPNELERLEYIINWVKRNYKQNTK